MLTLAALRRVSGVGNALGGAFPHVEVRGPWQEVFREGMLGVRRVVVLVVGALLVGRESGGESWCWWVTEWIAECGFGVLNNNVLFSSIC